MIIFTLSSSTVHSPSHLVVPHIFGTFFHLWRFYDFSRRFIPSLVGRAFDDMGFAGQQLIELRNQITLSLAHRYRHPRIIGVWHRKRAGNSFEAKAAAVENYVFGRPAGIARKGICSNAIPRRVHEGRAGTDNTVDGSPNSSLVQQSSCATQEELWWLTLITAADVAVPPPPFVVHEWVSLPDEQLRLHAVFAGAPSEHVFVGPIVAWLPASQLQQPKSGIQWWLRPEPSK